MGDTVTAKSKDKSSDTVTVKAMASFLMPSQCGDFRISVPVEFSVERQALVEKIALPGKESNEAITEFLSGASVPPSLAFAVASMMAEKLKA